VRGVTQADCRIDIRRRTARWDPAAEVTAAEAMDFWAFAAGAANVIMQLSRPEVGYGVAESKVDSGNLLKHPWKRARTTFQYLAVAILGRPDDRAAFGEAVNSSHRHVRSSPSSPVRYDAFDRELQMWVAACLFVGLEDTYQLLRGRMTAEQAEQFYRSAWTLGTTLQVTEDQWPPHPGRLRRLLGSRLPARRDRRAGRCLSAGSTESANDQSGSRTALPATAEVPHRRVLGAGVPRSHGSARLRKALRH
jgi:uncharacterized protein (DUF2236 family)